MKQIFLFIFLLSISFFSFAQNSDSDKINRVIVHEDYRMDILAKKESDINTSILKAQARLAKGFRLMILNTNDRAYAMKIRTMLLQEYPDEKTYMWFANPYIKIKFGNFRTEDEANSYKKNNQ